VSAQEVADEMRTVSAMAARNWSGTQVGLTAVVVIGLGIDAWVHLDLASAFSQVRTSTMSQADIFRIDSAVAIVAALALLVHPRRYTAAFAFLVAAAGTVAVVLYRCVDVGTIGPIPNMYDPYWAPAGKALSAIGEALAAVAAFALFVVLHRSSATTPRASRRVVRVSAT
jgi:hypothetical protein